MFYASYTTTICQYWFLFFIKDRHILSVMLNLVLHLGISAKQVEDSTYDYADTGDSSHK